jgi:IS4 transposase
MNNTEELLAEVQETSRKMEATLKKRIKRRGESLEQILAAAREASVP